MSVRPRVAFEAAQTFSLRDALGADTSAPQIAPHSGNLKFNLTALSKVSAAASTPPTPPVGLPLPSARVPGVPTSLSMRFTQSQPTAPKASVLIAAGSGHAPQNMSFMQMSQGAKPHSILGGQKAALAAKDTAAARSDVMRLSAYVDELTTRLKKTQHRLDQTEAQLTRTSQVLCHERQAADETLAGYKKDLAQAHETEAKLRSDFAASKKKSTLTDSTFMASVGSALASDEEVRVQQRKLSELETNVAAMGEFKVKMESEIAKLDSLRKAALKDLEQERSAQEERLRVVAVAQEELTLSQKQLVQVQADHGGIQERLAAAKVEEATLSEALVAMRLEKDKAEAETVSARSAARAMMLEHGDVSNKLCAVQKRVDELQCQQDAANETLRSTQLRAMEAEEKLATIITTTDAAIATTQAPAVPLAQTKPAKRRAVISGAFAPNIELSSRISTTPNVPGGKFAGSVASLLATDAPIGLTLMRVAFVGSTHAILMENTAVTAGITGSAQSGEGDATAGMINAVVLDLKSKLTEISQLQPVWRAVAPLA